MGHVPYATMKYVTIYISVCVPNITADRGQRKRLEKWHMYLNIYVSSNIHGNIYGYIYIYIYIYIYTYIRYSYRTSPQFVDSANVSKRSIRSPATIYVPWPCHHRFLICVPWVMHTCAVTFHHVWRDTYITSQATIYMPSPCHHMLLICVPRLTYMCAMTHARVCRNVRTCMTWLMQPITSDYLHALTMS